MKTLDAFQFVLAGIVGPKSSLGRVSLRVNEVCQIMGKVSREIELLGNKRAEESRCEGIGSGV